MKAADEIYTVINGPALAANPMHNRYCVSGAGVRTIRLLSSDLRSCDYKPCDEDMTLRFVRFTPSITDFLFK